MRIFYFLILYILFLPTKSPAQWQQEDFDVFLQLKGTWQVEGGAEFEYWTSQDKNTLKGMGYTLKSADTIVNEKLELRLSEGSIYYTATVTHQNSGLPVQFDYKGREGDYYLFENKQHDFPQVIIYTFQDKDTLLITLKGQGKKHEKTVQFIMSRLKH